MKSVGEILKELGFNKEAPRAAQVAFLKHLAAAASQAPTVLNVEKQRIARSSARDEKQPGHKIGEQLEFDLLKAVT